MSWDTRQLWNNMQWIFWQIKHYATPALFWTLFQALFLSPALSLQAVLSPGSPVLNLLWALLWALLSGLFWTLFWSCSNPVVSPVVSPVLNSLFTGLLWALFWALLWAVLWAGMMPNLQSLLCFRIGKQTKALVLVSWSGAEPSPCKPHEGSGAFQIIWQPHRL